MVGPGYAIPSTCLLTYQRKGAPDTYRNMRPLGNTQGSSRPGLLDLPDDCVIQVVTKLEDVRDVLRFQLCSKKCRDLTTDPSSWLKRLKNEFGVNLKVKGLSKFLSSSK